MALYTYLPKYCIRVCQNVAFLFTENIALLFTGYTWLAAGIFAAYMYLNNAHANRDQSTGKWAWNPTSWFGKGSNTTVVFGVKTNSDFTDATAFMGIGGNPFMPAFAVNSNSGVGFGVYTPQGTDFAYPGAKQPSAQSNANEVHSGIGWPGIAHHVEEYSVDGVVVDHFLQNFEGVFLVITPVDAGGDHAVEFQVLSAGPHIEPFRPGTGNGRMYPAEVEPGDIADAVFMCLSDQFFDEILVAHVGIPVLKGQFGLVARHYPARIEEQGIGGSICQGFHVVIQVHAGVNHREIGLQQPDGRPVPPGAVIAAGVNGRKIHLAGVVA